MDRFLENDSVLKIISVVIAILLWFIVSSSNPTQTTNRSFGPIPLSQSSLTRANLSVGALDPNIVTVTLKGSPQSVQNASVRQIAAFVELADITRAGTYSVPVRVSVPEGTSLVSVVPNHVVVTVDQLGTKHFAVVLHPLGTPAPGYEIKSSAVSVKEASVNGPTSELAQIRSVVADVSVGGRAANFQEQVILLPLNRKDQVVPDVQVSPNLVTATVAIQPIPPQKTVPVVVKYTGAPAAGYQVGQIAVTPATVDITGTTAALSGISQINTQVVSVAGQTSTVTETVPLAFPKGISGMTINSVTVTITISPSG